MGSPASDIGYDITLDVNNNIFVTAYSQSTWGNPINAYVGSYDIAVMKLNNDGVLQWNTFLGSSSTDIGNRIAVDDNGDKPMPAACNICRHHARGVAYQLTCHLRTMFLC